jgi:hypothetical protein
MGRTQRKTEPEPEEAKVLSAREALSLISGGRDEDAEEDSGGGEEPVGDPEGARDPAAPEA